MRGTNKGIILATTAALLMSSQSFATDSQSVTPQRPVKCFGVNSCKGKAQCGSVDKHSCAGQNSCKGKGWIFLTPEDCNKKGGTIVK